MKTFEFANVVFYGRNLEEYRKMFGLTDSDLIGKRILDCCAGPASFAKEASELGASVTACDPMYSNEHGYLDKRVHDDVASVDAKQKQFRNQLHTELTATSVRLKAMEDFLADFPVTRQPARYVPGCLPSLPFTDQQFDLTLCGNLLFLYSDKQSGGMMDNSSLNYEFHRQSLFELMRVTSGELRLYPLQGVGASHHTYVEPVMAELSEAGFACDLVPVAHRDIIGAEKMLRVKRAR